MLCWRLVALWAILPACGAAAAGINDAAVREAVSSQLFRDRMLDPQQVRAEVVDGLVTLRGSAEDLRVADRAVRLAEAIRGVRWVRSELRVGGPERPGSEILGDAVSALALGAATRGLEVRIQAPESAVAGVVELSGAVRSWSEKSLVESVVMGVPGVHELRSGIRIRVGREIPELRLVRDVIQSLHQDPWLQEESVRVHADPGTIRITGIVSNAVARRRAFEAAWVEGVRRVDISQLSVIPGARTGPGPMPLPRIPAPADIVSGLSQELARDARLSGARPRVEMENGAVTLTGDVPTLAARLAAEENAWNTIGVAAVENRIRVQAPTTRPETVLSQEIRAAFRVGLPASVRDKLGFGVAQGTVTVTGKVRSPYWKWQVFDSLARLPGVTGITDQIRIEPPIRAGDAEIRSKALAGLSFDPLLSPGRDRVEVAVQGGIVRLTGEVDGWPAHLAATREALEAGASRVENAVRVRGVAGEPRLFTYHADVLPLTSMFENLGYVGPG